MQLIWTPKLINICGEETREWFRPARRPFFGNPPQEVCNDLFFSFLWRGPFAIYLRLIIKQPKAYVLFAHKDENKLVASLAIFQLSTCHLPHATESSWAEPKSSFHTKFTFFGAMIYCQRALQTEKPRENKLKKWKEKGKRISRRPEMKFKAS